MTKNYNAKERKRYIEDFNKKFPWLNVFYRINRRCNNKTAHNYYLYGGKGIKTFLTKEDVKMLWFRDKAYDLKRPSIDRIDSEGHYCVENCRFIELSDNSKRKKVGNRVVVFQTDITTKQVTVWNSLLEVEKTLNHSWKYLKKVIKEKRILKNSLWSIQ